MNLRDWMRKAPKPAALRLDGKPIALVPGRQQWAEAEKTIAAVGGTRLECIDAAGAVLRAVELDKVDEEEDDAKKPAKLSEVAQIAGIIAGAYKDAYASANAKSEQSDQKLRDIAQMAFDAFAKMFADRVKEIEERAAAGDDDDDKLTGKLLGGMLDGSLKVHKDDAPAEAKPNGTPPAPAPAPKKKGAK